MIRPLGRMSCMYQIRACTPVQFPVLYSSIRSPLPGWKSARNRISSMTFQELLITLERFWAEQGCLIMQPYDVEVGAGTNAPTTTLRALVPGLERSLRPPVSPPGGWPICTQPHAHAALLPVPGHYEALSREYRRPLPGQPARHWYPAGRPRHTLCGGRLGGSDAWRIGRWLGSLDGRHRNHAIYLFSADGRGRVQDGFCRNNLWYGTIGLLPAKSR